jgi:hypothetical protein
VAIASVLVLGILELTALYDARWPPGCDLRGLNWPMTLCTLAFLAGCVLRSLKPRLPWGLRFYDLSLVSTMAGAALTAGGWAPCGHYEAISFLFFLSPAWALAVVLFFVLPRSELETRLASPFQRRGNDQPGWTFGPALLVVIAGGVQFWILWTLTRFNHRPTYVHVSAGTALYFALAILAAGFPRGETRRNVLLTAILALVSGWVLHLDELVNYPRHHYDPTANLLGVMVCYLLMVGAPSWMAGLAVTLGSQDSRTSFSQFTVEVFKLTWLKVACVFLLAGLQLRLLLMLAEMRAPASLGPLSAMIAAFFIASLVRTLWPGAAGIEVLWRSLTWAVALVLLSGLRAAPDPWLAGAWIVVATDLFAFLTPVWLLRLWLGAERGYRAPHPPGRPLSNRPLGL